MSVNPAELFGMQTPAFALVVSLLSFTVAVTTLGWQVVKHVLDGGRVRVQLNAAVLSESAMAVNDTGKWGIAYPPFDGGAPSAHLEVAHLVVENPGRYGVTVHGPALVVSGARAGRYAICPALFGFTGDETVSTQSLVRLEPYSRVTFLLDYWDVVESVRERRDGSGDTEETAAGGGVRLRGMVRVAGRRKPRKSSRWRAWRIPNDAWTSRSDVTELDPHTVMWRELYREHRAVGRRDAEEAGVPFARLQMVVHRARRMLTELPTVERLERALNDAADELGLPHTHFGGTALHMHAALTAHAPHLAPWRTAPESGAAATRGALAAAD
ncbi:hypothetical protein [Streptomyces sp. NPDC097619]|uniref:hypothetical protein n=1 Tax=Streptomyces sp. NPDC097619 TaxID=3157228 RepID=UPI0033317635